MGIGFAKLTDIYPIMNLQGSTWTTRDISGADCLQMAINANANNNIFILQPTSTSGHNGYTILTGKIDSENAYLFDENSGHGSVSGYSTYGGYRNNSGISRPDLRGIRLSGASGLSPNYSGNVNGTQVTWNSNVYTTFGYYDNIGYDILIYLPPSVTNILINDAPLITYTWSSVPAISGKNGILSLPTLVDTDGEPISGQSASVFSSLPEGSNVRALINGAL